MMIGIIMFFITWILAGILAVVIGMYADRRSASSYEFSTVSGMIAFGYIALVIAICFTIAEEFKHIKNPFYKE